MLGHDRPDERIRFTESGNPDINLLRRELGLLNEKSRKAMIYYYFEGKSYSEISTLLNLIDDTIKQIPLIL